MDFINHRNPLSGTLDFLVTASCYHAGRLLGVVSSLQDRKSPDRSSIAFTVSINTIA